MRAAVFFFTRPIYRPLSDRVPHPLVSWVRFLNSSFTTQFNPPPETTNRNLRLLFVPLRRRNQGNRNLRSRHRLPNPYRHDCHASQNLLQPLKHFIRIHMR